MINKALFCRCHQLVDLQEHSALSLCITSYCKRSTILNIEACLQMFTNIKEQCTEMLRAIFLLCTIVRSFIHHYGEIYCIVCKNLPPKYSNHHIEYIKNNELLNER